MHLISPNYTPKKYSSRNYKFDYKYNTKEKIDFKMTKFDRKMSKLHILV